MTIIITLAFIISLYAVQTSYAEDRHNSVCLFPNIIAQEGVMSDPSCDNGVEAGIGIEYKINKIGIYGILQYQYNVNDDLELAQNSGFNSYQEIPVMIGITFYF